MSTMTIIVQSPKDTTRFDTDGYVLLYLKDGKVQATGTIELSSIAPLLLRLASEKLSK